MNTPIHYGKLFGWGILIWAVAYLIATLFVAYSFENSLVAQIAIILGAAIAAYVAGRYVREDTVTGMLRYSIGWVIIGLVLDLILTVPFTGWSIFASWNIWVGYVLVAVAPLLAILNKEEATSTKTV